MLSYQQAKSIASRQGSGAVDNVIPHLHDHVYFCGTPGHGYLLADLRGLPNDMYRTLNDSHMMSGAVGVGEEDCHWAMILVVAAHMYPDADWDAGYGTVIGTSARVEQAVAVCLRWSPLEFAWLLEGMAASGDAGWENYAVCLAAVAEEVQAHA
jgi:hypothetical protein